MPLLSAAGLRCKRQVALSGSWSMELEPGQPLPQPWPVPVPYCLISAKQDSVQEKNGVPLSLAKYHNSHLISGFLRLKAKKWEWRSLQEDKGNETGFSHLDKCLREQLTVKGKGSIHHNSGKLYSFFQPSFINCFVLNLKYSSSKMNIDRTEWFTFITLNSKQV